MTPLLKRRQSLICAVMFYVVIALIITYPLSTQLASHLAGVPGEDALQHLWISWWTQFSLIDLGISPMQVDWLYYPDGVIHPMLWVTPYAHIAAVPLSLLSGEVPAYNIHLLLSFVLSALTTYLLVFYLTRNRIAALLGGLMFAIFPNRMMQSTAHLAQVINYLFPLFVLYLIKLKREPNLNNAIKFGLILGFSLLVNVIHIAYLILPVLVVLLGYWAVWDRERFWREQTLKYVIAGLLIGLLICAPFLLPFLWYTFTGRLDYLQQGGVADFSADLLAFFVPAASHPLLSHWQGFREFSVRLVGSGNLRENTVYLGIIPILLAFWGIRNCRRIRTLPWLVLGASMMVLSLGPTLKLGGYITGIPLPYALAQQLPFYKWGRIPGRANETIILALAILAGYGYAVLHKRLKKDKKHFIITAMLFVLIGLEYWTVWPFPTMSATTPSFYQDWARETEDFAVLDLPQWPLWLREASNYAMFYQTTHEHKIVGGYVWRLPEHRAGTMKAFQELLWPDGQTDIIPRRRGAKAIPLLNQYGIRYVTVHRTTLPPEDEENDLATITAALGEPFYNGSEVVAFNVPRAPQPESPEPLKSFGYNWYMVEPVDGRPARWLKNDGTLYIHWLKEPVTSHYLTFSVSPFEQPRHLLISVNGEEMEGILIEGRQMVELGPLALQKGQNNIAFHVLEGCDVPADIVPGNQDRRCLSLLFQDMSLSPVSGGNP